MKAVEHGNVATGLVNNYYWFAVAQEVGAANMRSAVYYLEHQDPGALITVSAAGILKASKKQALAQQLLAFMASDAGQKRSEEHTSELQSLMRISYAVFCLKKKK